MRCNFNHLHKLDSHSDHESGVELAYTTTDVFGRKIGKIHLENRYRKLSKRVGVQNYKLAKDSCEDPKRSVSSDLSFKVPFTLNAVGTHKNNEILYAIRERNTDD